jgi:hypothetical protein
MGTLAFAKAKLVRGDASQAFRAPELIVDATETRAEVTARHTRTQQQAAIRKGRR